MRKWLLFGVTLVLIIWVLFIVFSVYPKTSTGRAILDIEDDEEKQQEDDFNTDNQRFKRDESSKENKGIIEESLSDCKNYQISYSIINFNEDITDSTATCYLEVQNLDFKNSGDFEIRLRILEQGNEIDSQTLGYFIKPREIKEFEAVFAKTINQQVSCSYQTIKIPKKEIC